MKLPCHFRGFLCTCPVQGTSADPVTPFGEGWSALGAVSGPLGRVLSTRHLLYPNRWLRWVCFLHEANRSKKCLFFSESKVFHKICCFSPSTFFDLTCLCFGFFPPYVPRTKDSAQTYCELNKIVTGSGGSCFSVGKVLKNV